MRVLLALALIAVVVHANPSLKWYQVQPALDAKAEGNDARLSEVNVEKHWQAFKLQHCKLFMNLNKSFI